MINKILGFFRSFVPGQEPVFGGKQRSSHWPKIREEHLLKEPCCQICGGIKQLSVHHIKPYHLDPLKELDLDNLITLCEYRNCHLTFGHLFYWESYNVNIREDAAFWAMKVKKRP